MDAGPPQGAGGPAPWGDLAWWTEQIDQALATRDPVLANLRITQTHYQLSLALRTILGPTTGANFHTWATWGSKKAGTTIRHADVSGLPALARLVGGGVGLLGAVALRSSGMGPLLATLSGSLLGSWGLGAWTQQRLAQASQMILAGNRTVLDEIGRQTARFVSTFHAHPAPDAQRLADFLGPLRPGPATVGGQALLRSAFTHYYQARHAPDHQAAQEALLLGNLYAILQEHIRLQPYIAGAMPRLARRLITRRLLHFAIGGRTLSVGQDVVPWAGAAHGGRRRPVANPELRDFLAGPGGWDGPPDNGRGNQAGDWTDLRERMHYICALFCTGQDDPTLFRAPYTAAQRAAIVAGRIPCGAL